MSNSPSGFSGGSKANKILGKSPTSSTPKPTASKPPATKPTATKPTATKPGAIKPTTAFKPATPPKTTPKLAPGAPVLGQQRLANPSKAAQVVNADRLKGTFKQMGF